MKTNLKGGRYYSFLHFTIRFRYHIDAAPCLIDTQQMVVERGMCLLPL